MRIPVSLALISLHTLLESNLPFSRHSFLMLGIILLIPETPRWLVAHDRPAEALDVLRRLNRHKLSDDAIQAIHADIVNTVAYESALGTGSWADIVRSDDLHSRRRFLIACSIQLFQQAGGINALIYYSNTIFQQSLGFDNQLAALMSGFLNTWFFVASFIPCKNMPSHSPHHHHTDRC